MADKEYIERGALLRDIHQNPTEAHGERCAQILEAILNAPAEDVVKIVRCKDCRDYEPHGNGKVGLCQNKSCKGIRYATDFCSYGKPKE